MSLVHRSLALLACLASIASCAPQYALTPQQLQAKQPLNGLPAPSNTSYSLAYTALGIGHQNYTCNGAAFVQNQLGDGASALLYDTTWYLEQHPGYINKLAQKCNFRRCTIPNLINSNSLLGDHYFSELVQPTFNLTQANPDLVLSGTKSGDVAAPNATKNVDWLYLTPNPNNDITQGLKAVYRIDTFRGRSPTSCSISGQTTSIPYTAQYWFYE